MSGEEGIDRRTFLKVTAAAASAAAAGCATPGGLAGGGGLPARGEFTVRDAYVLSMDRSIGDLPRGDVHVRAGQIVAVGTGLKGGGETIDGRDRLVMPGFVDTHFHLWTTALRALIRNDDAPNRGYFAATAKLGPHFTPADCYRSARLGIAEALHSGVTTVHDWNHNILSPAHADAGVQAIVDSGVRARFAYGYNGRMQASDTMDLLDLARLQRALQGAHDGLISLGICSRSITNNAALLKSIRADWAGARKLGVPITLHLGNAGTVAQLEKEGLLGPDVQFVHPELMTAAEMKMLADRRCTFSISPVTEMRRLQERGDIQYSELEQLRVQMSLSTDHVAGLNCDFFNQMRVLHWNHSRRIGDKVPVTTRRLVELATIEGARDMRIDDRVGSLTPGKRADVILLRTSDANIAPMGDPTHALVFTAQPVNVEMAAVDGRVLLRDGRLTYADERHLGREAGEAAQGIRQRGNWT
jgi:5-methylthioadenosine/S-adenosylhomocysteine deaminase